MGCYNQIYHNMLILGTSCLFIFANRDDYFGMLIMQSKIFQFNDNDMGCLKRDLKTLLSSLVSTYRHCLSMRMSNEA